MAKPSSSSFRRSPPSDTTHHFFKVYFPHLSLLNLKISSTFINKLNGAVPRKAILKDPLERTWHVEVKKKGGDYYFQNGWKEFVIKNGLKVGEFLVFTYMGNSIFDVSIFDYSGCEKEDFKMETDHHESDESHEEVESDDDDDDDDDEDETYIISEDEEWEEKEEEEEEEEEKIFTSKSFAATTKSFRANNGYSEVPNFVASLRPSCPYILNIPTRLVKNHDLKLKPQMRLLDPNRRPWDVKILFPRDGRTVIAKGWWDFCNGNNLTPDDQCTFEFNRYGTESDLINVKIDRARSYGSSATS